MILPKDQKKTDETPSIMNTQISKLQMVLFSSFYLLFYAFPIVIMPMLVTKMDYLIFTNLHLAPREVVVKEKAVYGD